MYTLRTAAAITALTLFAGACSSGLEDNVKQVEPTAAFEKAFGAYDTNKDGNLSSEELARVEGEETADAAINTYDMNGDQLISKVEFTGLLRARILVGVPKDLGLSK